MNVYLGDSNGPTAFILKPEDVCFSSNSVTPMTIIRASSVMIFNQMPSPLDYKRYRGNIILVSFPPAFQDSALSPAQSFC